MHAGINCAEIGDVADGPAVLQRSLDGANQPWPLPSGDAIAAVFAAGGNHQPGNDSIV
jgi:hypothetical protein